MYLYNSPTLIPGYIQDRDSNEAKPASHHSILKLSLCKSSNDEMFNLSSVICTPSSDIRSFGTMLSPVKFSAQIH